MTTVAAASPALVANRVLRDNAAALRRHFEQCHAARGRWYGAAALAERVHGLIAPRFVSTAAVAFVILGIATHWI